MTMMKRAVILLVAGFCFLPAVASAEEMLTEQGAATTVEHASTVAEPAVIIEDLLGSVGDTETSRLYPFTGNANEMIVISVEPPSGYEGMTVHAESVRLRSPSGGFVYGQNDDSLSLHLDKPNGYHRVFLLPETGEYQLTQILHHSH